MTKEEITRFFNTTRPFIQGNPDLRDPQVEGLVPYEPTFLNNENLRKVETMIQELEKIEYRRGMLEKGMKPKDLPVNVWRGTEIPADVRAAVNTENLLNLGGVYGDKKAGDPMEYDNLKLVLTDDTVEITVFNRGIALFMSDDERIRRIHRVLCKLDGTGKD